MIKCGKLGCPFEAEEGEEYCSLCSREKKFLKVEKNVTEKGGGNDMAKTAWQKRHVRRKAATGQFKKKGFVISATKQNTG